MINAPCWREMPSEDKSTHPQVTAEAGTKESVSSTDKQKLNKIIDRQNEVESIAPQIIFLLSHTKKVQAAEQGTGIIHSSPLRGSVHQALKLAIGTQVWVPSSGHWQSFASLWNQFFPKKCQKASLPLQVRAVGTLQSSVLRPGDACMATGHNLSNLGWNIFIFSLQFPHFSHFPKHATKLSENTAKEQKIDFGTGWAQALNPSIFQTCEQKLHYCACTSTPLVQK